MTVPSVARTVTTDEPKKALTIIFLACIRYVFESPLTKPRCWPCMCNPSVQDPNPKYYYRVSHPNNILSGAAAKSDCTVLTSGFNRIETTVTSTDAERKQPPYDRGAGILGFVVRTTCHHCLTFSLLPSTSCWDGQRV